MRRKTLEEFIKEAKATHGNKYDYSCVNYKSNNTKVKIFCNKCKKYFEQRPSSHVRGQGCPFCNRKNKTTESFIEEAKAIHGDKYNYDHVVYVNEKTKIKIWCNNCKEFFYQAPRHHLRKCGCWKCARKRMDLDQSLSLDEFIKRSISIHGDKYDYNYVNYKNIKGWVLEPLIAFYDEDEATLLYGYSNIKSLDMSSLDSSSTFSLTEIVKIFFSSLRSQYISSTDCLTI